MIASDIRVARKRPVLLFGYLLFLVELSLSLPIIPFPRMNIVADRYLYLALIGLSIAGVYEIRQRSYSFLSGKKKWMALGLFIFLLGISGHLQWAAAGYGYHSISLNPRILAQDSGSGGNQVSGGTVNKPTGGVSAGDGGPRTFGKEKGPCEFVLAGQGTAEIHLMGGKITPNANGPLSVLFKNASIDCTVDGKYTDCTAITCLEFYERLFK